MWDVTISKVMFNTYKGMPMRSIQYAGTIQWSEISTRTSQ